MMNHVDFVDYCLVFMFQFYLYPCIAKDYSYVSFEAHWIEDEKEMEAQR